MITNLVISGGPLHDFAATSALIDRSLALDGVASVVVDDPHEAIARLADPAEHWDLVTVNALHAKMGADRHEPLRQRWAFELRDDEGEALAAHVRRGGGLLALHSAVICFDAQPDWHATVGASWNWERSSHPPVGEVTVTVTDAGRTHPITEGLGSFLIEDEVYGFLDEEPGLVALLTSRHGGRDHPLLWARPLGQGRVVTDLLGHSTTSLHHPAHAQVLRRAARWATGRTPVETTITPVGAEIGSPR